MVLTADAGLLIAAEGRMGRVLVVAVGPGRRKASDGELVPMGVKSGDNVLLPDFGGQPLKMGDKEFFLYRDEEILGLVEKI